MNTAEFDTRLRHSRRISAETTERPRTAAAIPVVVLSTDGELCEALRTAAAEEHPLVVVSTLEQALQLAAADHCGILITDQALGQQALHRISKQLHVHDPAIITIAVGSRGDDNALIGLLSSAVVERFMLKPVTPALARLVLKSASSEYRSAKSRSRSDALLKAHHLRQPEAAPTPASAPAVVETKSDLPRANGVALHEPREIPELPPEVEAPAYAPTRVRFLAQPRATDSPASAHVAAVPAAGGSGTIPAYIPWLAGAIAVLFAIAATWWATSQRAPQIDPQQIIASSLKSAQAAFAAGHYIEPAESSAVRYYSTVLAIDPANASALQGMERTAGKMADGVKELILEGRLAEAGIALERLRRISADPRRASMLEEQLRKEQASQLLALSSRPAAPVTTSLNTVAPTAAPARKAAPARTQAPPVRSSLLAEPVPAVSSAGKAAELPPLSAAPSPAIAAVAAAGAVTETTHQAAPAETRASTMESVTAPATDAAPQIAAAVSTAPVAAPAATIAATVTTPETASAIVPEPRLIRMVQPEYPGDARMRGIEGWVDMTLAVNAAGRVANARVDSSSKLRMFDKAAITAVRKWQYEPRTLPYPDATQSVRVRVQFKLAD